MRFQTKSQGRVLSFFGANWWVIGTLLLLFGVFLQASHRKRGELQELTAKIDRIQKEMREITAQREILEARIASQGDPEWIELLLKERLGVKGEGEVKVVFK